MYLNNLKSHLSRTILHFIQQPLETSQLVLLGPNRRLVLLSRPAPVFDLGHLYTAIVLLDHLGGAFLAALMREEPVWSVPAD